MSGLRQWLSVAGPALRAKTENLQAQAAENYANAGYLDTQGQVLAGRMPFQNNKDFAEANQSNASAKFSLASAKNLDEERPFIAGLRRSQIGLNDASAGQARANTGLIGQQTRDARNNNEVFEAGKPGIIARRRAYGDSPIGTAFPGAAGAMPTADQFGITPEAYIDSRGVGVSSNMQRMKGLNSRKSMSQSAYGYDGMGYAKGGAIGNVKHDDGTDKIDVKVRPGEYMLNPETVEFIGGGDYREGLRNLDNLVRQATGKEPGPSPAGKPGEPGYALGGWAGDAWNWGKDAVNTSRDWLAEKLATERAAQAQAQAQAQAVPSSAAQSTRAAPEAAKVVLSDSRAVVPIEGTGRTGYTPNWTYYDPANAPKSAWQQFRENPTKFGAQAGQAARDTAGRIATNPAVVAAKGTAKVAAAPVILEALAPRHQEFFGDDSVPTWDKARQLGREVVREGVGAVGAAVGGGAGSVAAPVVGTIAGGVAGYAGGKGLATLALDSVFGDSPAAQYEAKMRKDGKTPAVLNTGWFGPADAAPPQKGGAGADSAKKAPTRFEDLSEDQKDGLRKQYVDAYQKWSKQDQADKLHSMAMELGVLGDKGGMKYMEQYMNGQTSGKSGASALAAHAKEIDDRLSERYQTPVLDKEGNVKSYTKNPDAARQVRDILASKGINIYTAPQALVDRELKDLDEAYRAIGNFNNVVKDERGDDSVVNTDLRRLGLRKGIELEDVIAPNNAVTFMDMLRANFSGDDSLNNMLVVDPDTGQTAAARKVFRRPDGTIDKNSYDKFKQMNQ